MAVRKLRASVDKFKADAEGLLTDFLQGLAPFTRNNYKHRFHCWMRFLEDRGIRFHQATSLNAKDFISEVRKTPGVRDKRLPSEKMVRSYMAINHSIYKRGICPFYPSIENPFAAVLAMKTKTKPEKPRRPLRIVPDEHVLVLEALAQIARTKKQIMQAAMFACFCAGGLRLEEVELLELGQVCFMGKILYFHLPVTKSAEEQDRAVMQWGTPFIKRYLEQRKEEGAGPEDRLFIRYDVGDEPASDRMARSTIPREFARMQKAAGIKKPYSCHCWRATAITKLAMSGVRLVEIQKLSGHKHLISLESYIKLTDVIKNFKGLEVSFQKRRKKIAKR